MPEDSDGSVIYLVRYFDHSDGRELVAWFSERESAEEALRHHAYELLADAGLDAEATVVKSLDSSEVERWWRDNADSLGLAENELSIHALTEDVDYWLMG